MEGMKGVNCEGMNGESRECQGVQGVRLRVRARLDEIPLHRPPVVPVLRVKKKGVLGRVLRTETNRRLV